VSDSQRSIYSFLESIGGTPLANLFATVVIVADEKKLPSYAYLFAHLVREILNGVVRNIVGQGSQSEIIHEFRAISAILTPALNETQSIEQQVELGTSHAILRFPVDQIPKLHEHLFKGQQLQDTFRARVSKLYSSHFTNTGDVSHVLATTEFLSLQKEIMERTHYALTQKLLSDEEIDETLIRLETVLLPFSKSFVESLCDLDEILQIANESRD
jgi:hypothetical protein